MAYAMLPRKGKTMTNPEKYIEFGSQSDRLWIVDMNLENHLDKALRVRGYANVSWGQALCSSSPQNAWEDTKYLNGEDKLPPEVHFVMWRDHPLHQEKPIAASASPEVAQKVVEAMELAFPQWEYSTKAQERPE